MNKIPSLPFASSIAGGEQHAGVKPSNDTVFNLHYYADLYKVHENDIPQLLSEKLARELSYYASEAHNDLAVILFERLISLDTQGIVCTPVITDKQKKPVVLATLAYHFCLSEETLDVAMSIMNIEKEDYEDCPFFAFTAEKIPGNYDLGIAISTDVKVPIMLMQSQSEHDLVKTAWHWVKFICAFEAMFAYRCIKYHSFAYDAMLQKNGEYLNPNFVKVNLLTLEGEGKDNI